MNIKSVALSLAVSTLALAPNMASAHTLLGKTVHLDVSAGTMEERIVGTDGTNVSSVSARLSSDLSKRLSVYLTGSESYVSHSGFLTNGYNALTGTVGASYHASPNITLNAEAGNRVNDQRFVAGSNRTIPFVGVSITDRLF